MNKTIIFTGVAAIILVLGFVYKDNLFSLLFLPTSSNLEEGIRAENRQDEEEMQVIATGLNTPWDLVFLPDGDMLITERSGVLRRVGENNQSYVIDDVLETAEGGLLGVSLHPDYASNHQLYLYQTYRENGQTFNRVDLYIYENSHLEFKESIIRAIPGSGNHNGGMIAFGPDDKLYITTGDAENPQSAQDTNSLSGKILRLNDDGSFPDDNPFDNAVYSYGHRNPQGIVWDGEGRLWSVEHGPSVTASGEDELNLITKGGNYGWPDITGSATREGMVSPVAESGRSETWAPGAVAFNDGKLFFTGLRGQSLYEVDISGEVDNVALKRNFSREFGRLRLAVVHEGYLYIGTSNRDGRGNPSTDDDQIIKIPLAWFE